MQIRLKEIMSEKAVTSVSLASKVGVSKVTVSNLINGKTMPSIETIDKIATALNVPIWQLFISPNEICNSGVITCPHCGKPIKIELK